ncbi:MAG: hypothetical protein FJ146_17550 [Deltaproteobacteria bacterium]|nr:hypothetical protein [Deltaproteobacteria bacterium]
MFSWRWLRQWLRHWPYLLLPLLGACVLMRTAPDSDPAAAKKSAPEALLVAVQLLGGGVGEQAQQVLRDLDQAEATATPGELGAIKKLRPLVERLTASDPTLSAKDYARAARVMNLIARDHPDDFDLQLATTKALDFVGQILHSSPTQLTSPEDERVGAPNALSRALSLVGKFPSQSRAHAHLAEVLTASGGDQLTAMRSFVRCLQLDPNNKECRSGLRVLTKEYTRARCREYRSDAVTVYRAAPKAKGRGWQRVTVGKQILMMDKAPLLNGTDIAEVSDLPGQRGQSMMTLRPAAAARFEGWTEEMAQNESYLVVQVAGKAVAAPRVLSAAGNGQLTLNVASATVEKSCRLFERRRLPDDIASILRD